MGPDPPLCNIVLKIYFFFQIVEMFFLNLIDIMFIKYCNGYNKVYKKKSHYISFGGFSLHNALFILGILKKL